MEPSKLLSLLLLTASTVAAAQTGPQLPNMNLDSWSRKGGCWNVYAKGEKNPVWDTGNHGLSIFGINGTQPEYEHLAVKGPGKAAAKLESRKAAGIFVCGNLYTGKFLRIVRMKGAEIDFGIPFSGRPKALKGYLHYIPGIIDVTAKDLKHLKGTTDIARIEVKLNSADKPERVDSTSPEFGKQKENPFLVASGELCVSRDTGGYIPFEIPLEYRSDASPTYVVITCVSSKYAEHFTGSTDSVLYLDELLFLY